MSKYKIRYIAPEDQGNLKSWSDSLIEQKEKKQNQPLSVNKQNSNLNRIPRELTQGLINEIVRRDEADYSENLLKKDTVIKKEDLVRMQILSKARHSILKLDNNKALALKLEAFNKKLREKKLKAIVRAIRYYLNYD